MTPAAAIMGDYTDLVFRKTRAVAIISIEIPIEKAAEFVAAFGTPSQSTGTPVAIARIDPKAASEPVKAVEGPSEHERRKWGELAPAKQAAIRCKDRAFQKFINQHAGYPPIEDAATQYVREWCMVTSRADILDGTRAADKWRELDGIYNSWRSTFA